MAGDDFWGGFNGNSWNPNDPQWRLGDQMRRHNEQQQTRAKQHQDSLSSQSGLNGAYIGSGSGSATPLDPEAAVKILYVLSSLGLAIWLAVLSIGLAHHWNVALSGNSILTSLISDVGLSKLHIATDTLVFTLIATTVLLSVVVTLFAKMPLAILFAVVPSLLYFALVWHGGYGNEGIYLSWGAEVSGRQEHWIGELFLVLWVMVPIFLIRILRKVRGNKAKIKLIVGHFVGFGLSSLLVSGGAYSASAMRYDLDVELGGEAQHQATIKSLSGYVCLIEDNPVWFRRGRRRTVERTIPAGERLRVGNGLEWRLPRTEYWQPFRFRNRGAPYLRVNIDSNKLVNLSEHFIATGATNCSEWRR